MPRPRSLDSHRPASVKRLPWMRRVHVYSSKVDRMLVLFSHQTVALWALAESSPLIESFCEYPGYVQLDGKRVLADLWVKGEGREARGAGQVRRRHLSNAVKLGLVHSM